MPDVVLIAPEPVRLKALSTGRVGEAWLAGLPGMLRDLADEWDLSIGRTLPGGTEAFVSEVTMADGRDAVLKLGLPGHGATAGEVRTLRAARGRGYAELYRHDEARKAILMERLGVPLNALGWSADSQIEVICATLQQAWTTAREEDGFTTGEEKATNLGDFIEATWIELGRPCPERIIERALRYAELRRKAFDPNSAVLGHGDAHAWNTLLVPGETPDRFKLIDPDGLFIERAYDLGIQMREWTSELLAGDPVTLGRQRCRRLAELAGVDPESVWQWGFLERTSTGLLSLRIGLEGGRAMLDVANAWTSGL